MGEIKINSQRVPEFAGSATLGRAPLDAARQFLLQLANCSLNGGAFRALAERAHEPLLPNDSAIAEGLTYLGRPGPLDSALAPARRNINGRHVTLLAQPPAEELREAAATLTPDTLLALDVLLRRAIDPVSALVTWPMSAVFDADEVAWLESGALDSDRPSPTTKGRRVTLIVKLTRLCNLRCRYCHDWAAGPNQTMPLPVLATLFRKALGFPAHEQIEVIWHGGEPTLLKPKRFLKILWLQAHFRRAGQRITNVIQSNGTLIDTRWAVFLARYRFAVGLSLDGPRALNDDSRPSVRGGSTFSQVQRGMAALRTAGITPGVIMVIGSEQIKLGAEGLVRFFCEEGIRSVSLLPVRPTAGPERKGEAMLPIIEFVRLLLDIEQVLRASPDLPLRVRELETAKAAMAGVRVGFCEFAGKCAGQYFAIDPDGSVSHCDKYLGDPEFTIGNIVDNAFDDLTRSPRLTTIVENNRRAAERQATCQYFRFCQGWCPHERYMAERSGNLMESGCCGLAPLFEGLLRNQACST